MAFSTVDFFIKPTDGWVLVATNPTFLLARPTQTRAWRVAVTAGGAPQGSAARAVGTLTLAANALDAETVTIGGTVYTFKSPFVDVANNVAVGATASASLDNLIAAIVAGAGAGANYGTGTVANASATAVAGVGDTMDVSALVPGSAGNTIATTETMLNGSFGSATLLGGADAVRGIDMGNRAHGRKDEFRLEFAVAPAAEVYVLVPNPADRDDLEPLHLGVVRNQ